MVEYQVPGEGDLGTEDLGRVFSALGDPTRRAILERVCREGATTVGVLAEPYPISLNAVSKHLKILEGAGLLRRVVRGREHWFHADPAPLAEAREWLDQQRRFWEVRLRALDRYLGGGENTGSPGSGLESTPEREKEER